MRKIYTFYIFFLPSNKPKLKASVSESIRPLEIGTDLGASPPAGLQIGAQEFRRKSSKFSIWYDQKGQFSYTWGGDLRQIRFRFFLEVELKGRLSHANIKLSHLEVGSILTMAVRNCANFQIHISRSWRLLCLIHTHIN